MNQVPPEVEGEGQGVRADNQMYPDQHLMDDPAIEEVAGDEIMVPTINETETPVVQGNDKEQHSSTEQKTTRSGRKY